MVSYFKTQWWRLLIALFCLVMAFVYMFKPAPDTSTIEGLDTLITYMVTAGIHFAGFVIWSTMSFIDYFQECIELIEKKTEKYDALCEEVHALYEANRIDREYMHRLEQRIQQIKYDMENPV